MGNTDRMVKKMHEAYPIICLFLYSLINSFVYGWQVEYLTINIGLLFGLSIDSVLFLYRYAITALKVSRLTDF
jgi:uncharacterized membrane protein AbrB (regulator of aidB expression)